MADKDSAPSSRPAKAGVVRNALRLVSVLRVLLPEYRALRRFAMGTADNTAPVRFAASLVALGPTFVKLGQMLTRART
jgi:predicted unusual protein kinase regulating ubiquinone biosynthesis (AarF/ABC1/UbiB family)